MENTLELSIKNILQQVDFPNDWINSDDLELVRYLAKRLLKFSTLSIEDIHTNFEAVAYLYSESSISYEHKCLRKKDAAIKIIDLLTKEKALALTSESLFIREFTKMI